MTRKPVINPIAHLSRLYHLLHSWPFPLPPLLQGGNPTPTGVLAGVCFRMSEVAGTHLKGGLLHYWNDHKGCYIT